MARGIKKTHEEFVAGLEEKYPLKFEVLGAYTGNDKPVKIKHISCGCEWDAIPRILLYQGNCPDCPGNAPKTHERFVEEVRKLLGNDYEVRGQYVKSSVPVTMYHSVCEQEYEASPISILSDSKNKCRWCHGDSAKRLSHQQFIQRINNKHHGEYEVLTQYIGAHDKVQSMHKTCGYKWDILPIKLLHLKICPGCLNDGLVRTHEQFVAKIYEKFGNEYVVVGTYQGSNIPVVVRHATCKREYPVRPQGILRGTTCQLCYHKSRRKSHKQFVQEVYDILGDEYVVKGKYRGCKSPITIYHKRCQNEYTTTPNSIYLGSGCKCNMGKDHKQFVQEASNILGEDYVVVGKYIDCRTPITMYHKSCKREYETTPTSIVSQHTGCPRCNESHGEKRIAHFLDDYNLIYEQQHKFKNCRHKNRLAFDFVVFSSENLYCLIEYDGRQHFQSVDFFGGDESFRLSQTRDGIKNQYCADNNIKLIRIPYTEFDHIEEILSSELSEIIDYHNADAAI